jgi:hypothetical protein
MTSKLKVRRGQDPSNLSLLPSPQQHTEYRSTTAATVVVSLSFPSPLSSFYSDADQMPHAEPQLQSLLPNLPGANIPRNPIPIRLPVRRPTTSLPELRRNTTRTSRNRNSVPRLLTSLQAMWLLDLREPQDENGQKPQRHPRTRNVLTDHRVMPKSRTGQSLRRKSH